MSMIKIAEATQAEGMYRRNAALKVKLSELILKTKLTDFMLRTMIQTVLTHRMDEPTAKKGRLYVVFYQVIGARDNGSYLVNAADPAHAKQIVQRFDPDYAHLRVRTVKQAAGDYSSTVEDFMDRLERPAFGKATHIESGT